MPNMESTKRLSSLSEEWEEGSSAASTEGEKQNVTPKAHRHHRIISFDPPNVSSMSTREIHKKNEVTMSLVSSITTTTRSEGVKRRNAADFTHTVATPEDVESVKTGAAIRPHHIVKIFTGDDDVIEVTPEQVQRIKESKYHSCSSGGLSRTHTLLH